MGGWQFALSDAELTAAERYRRVDNVALVNTGHKFEPSSGNKSHELTLHTGTLTTGGPYTIKIDAGTETVIEGSAGIRYQFSRTWSASASVLLQHRIADWTVEETESGQRTTIDDYTVSGAYFGVNYRFQ